MHTVAIDAATGKEAWNTTLGDINKGETMTMAPLVAKGIVLVGNSGGEFGVRGWMAGSTPRSGKIVWRAYAAGPDKDVLIGSRFKPFYEKDRRQDLGVKTWPGEAWKIGGGWIVGLDLLRSGSQPYLLRDLESRALGCRGQRPGDNKWTAQFSRAILTPAKPFGLTSINPHDLYDYDGVNENILLDLPIRGQTRKVLLHPDRNGYVYVIDRMTGEVLSAAVFAPITTSSGVDLATGSLKYVDEKKPITGKVVRNLCPTAPGAKDWQPSAFSPRTGLLYIPQNNLCMDEEDLQANYIAGTPYVGANVRMYDAPGGYGGVFTAWDPVAGKVIWSVPDMFPVWSGALVTAGDIVFYGTMSGWFKAVDARSGQQLWQFKTGSGIIGQPVTYKGPDGKQYIAILSGVGGWAGAVVAGGLDVRDKSAALGFAGAMKDLPKYTNQGGMLYVFQLP